MATGVYEGRLVADGNGNLLADEGKHKGDPVAYDKDNDNFVFIGHDEPSHNERHHENLVGVVGTQDVDPDLPGYAGTADKPTKGNEHHFLTAADLPPVRQLPDNVAKKISGHTHQHKMGGDDE